MDKPHFKQALEHPERIIILDHSKTSNDLIIGKNDHVLMLDLAMDQMRLHFDILQKARIAGAQTTFCLFDTIPLYFPTMCTEDVAKLFGSWLASMLKISTNVICISKAVADELQEILQAIKFPRKINIGYWRLGADFSISQKIEIAPFDLSAIKFLMVGTIEPRKNHILAIEAFTDLWKQGFSGTLTIVGRTGWGQEHIVSTIKNHAQFGKKLIWLDDASDQDLFAAYSSSNVIIAASFAEGFGLPIIEGLQNGCQVLASDIPVFREVGGNSAWVRYFESNSKSALINEILATKEPPKQAAKKTWVNWNESALELLEVIENDQWYIKYIPPIPFRDAPERIGAIRVINALGPEDRQHRLELIGKPVPTNDGKHHKFTIKFENLSTRIFSSMGDNTGKHAIVLSYHVTNSHGKMLRFENARTSIPFIIPPSQSVYLGVEIVKKSLPKRAAFIEFEVVQEGVSWWSNPLKVAVP
jgi:glycosyltransferase involved in cell wall biosynthesis